MNNKLVTLVGTGVASIAVLIAGLYIKNKFFEKGSNPLDKATILKIMKKIRKRTYTIYRQIVPMHHQLNMQYQGKITAEQFKMFIQTPEAGINFKEKMEQITEKVCQEFDTTPSELKNNLRSLQGDKEINNILVNNEKQFNQVLSGKLNESSVLPPRDVVAQRLLGIQNRIVKSKYMIQVEVLKRMMGKTEKELMDPSIMNGLKSAQQQQEKILEDEGFDDTDEPSILVFNAAVKKHLVNQQFKIAFSSIQLKYKKIVQKYIPQIQKKTNPNALDQMEQEISFQI